MTGLLVVLGVVLLVVLAAVLSYNRFVSQRQLIDNSWANVDTELKRRYDLIPNLVETVKGYAAHERDTLEAVVAARTAAVAAGGPAGEQAGPRACSSTRSSNCSRSSSGIPDLKANEQFLALQKELVNTEDRIQAARRFYNGNVRDYNRRVESIPSNLIASLFGFERHDYFEVEPAIRAAGAPGVSLT